MTKLSAIVRWCAIALLLVSISTMVKGQERWVATWLTSPTGLPDTGILLQWNEAHPKLAWKSPSLIRGTFRYRLRVAKGGEKLRLTVSNSYRQAALVVGAMSVGLAASHLDVKAGTLKEVRFNGGSGIQIPAGTSATSDPVNLPVADDSDLIVSISFPDGVFVVEFPPRPDGPLVQIAEGTDQTGELTLHHQRSADVRSLLSEVDVLTSHCRHVVVALGDSITEGMVSNGERGWPGALARRLASNDISVVNAGIGGNRLLSPVGPIQQAAWARINDDVLTIPGISHIILLEGINDIGNGDADWEPFGHIPSVSAADLISAYRQIILKAHLHSIKVIGGTILPFEGAFYYSAEKESVRQAVNEWIRTSGEFDGVIDFESVVRDPTTPGRIRPDLASDPLHPNGKGYQLMGEAISVNLFD